MNKHADLILTNYEILKGAYFSELVNISSNLMGLKSTVFNDIGWNYVFSPNTNISISRDEANNIRENYKGLDPFFVYSPSQSVTFDGKPVSTLGDFSVWMSCTPESLVTVEHNNRVEILKSPSNGQVDQLVEIFRQAYCNNLSGQIGYNDLEESYPQGFKSMLETFERCTNIVIYDGNTVAGLATIAFDIDGRQSGLYNVSVLPEFRKSGLGKAVSYEAVRYAFSEGAKSCMLQTESYTEVETLYRSIGFSVDFHMQYATVS